MTIYDYPVHALDGGEASLADQKGKVSLIVNVASKCGLTPQYEASSGCRSATPTGASPCSASRATSSAARSRDRAEEIADVLLDHVRRHVPDLREDRRQRRRPRSALRRAHPGPDAEGDAGDIQWNFEKFLVSPDGEVVARFRPMVDPEAPS